MASGVLVLGLCGHLLQAMALEGGPGTPPLLASPAQLPLLTYTPPAQSPKRASLASQSRCQGAELQCWGAELSRCRGAELWCRGVELSWCRGAELRCRLGRGAVVPASCWRCLRTAGPRPGSTAGPVGGGSCVQHLCAGGERSGSDISSVKAEGELFIPRSRCFRWRGCTGAALRLRAGAAKGWHSPCGSSVSAGGKFHPRARPADAPCAGPVVAAPGSQGVSVWRGVPGAAQAPQAEGPRPPRGCTLLPEEPGAPVGYSRSGEDGSTLPAAEALPSTRTTGRGSERVSPCPVCPCPGPGTPREGGLGRRDGSTDWRDGAAPGVCPPEGLQLPVEGTAGLHCQQGAAGLQGRRELRAAAGPHPGFRRL